MKCVFKNTCDNGYLCCNHCKKKGCTDRCNGDHVKCKYYIDDGKEDLQVSPLHEDPFERTMKMLNEKTKKKDKTGE